MPRNPGKKLPKKLDKNHTPIIIETIRAGAIFDPALGNVIVQLHLELLITLPGNWKFDEESLKDEAWYWPIRLIKILARFPHKHNTWIGWGHTVPNSDPPRPYAQNTKLSGAIILSPIFVPDGFESLAIDERKVIHFFSVVTLYKEEMDLKMRSGEKTLLEKLVRADISGIVDINRPNVARKRFGLF